MGADVDPSSRSLVVDAQGSQSNEHVRKARKEVSKNTTNEACFAHGYLHCHDKGGEPGVGACALDMPGQGRTDVPSAEGCQSRCARDQGCAHFTWRADVGDGACYLQGEEAEKRTSSNSVTGPASCSTRPTPHCNWQTNVSCHLEAPGKTKVLVVNVASQNACESACHDASTQSGCCWFWLRDKLCQYSEGVDEHDAHYVPCNPAHERCEPINSAICSPASP